MSTTRIVEKTHWDNNLTSANLISFANIYRIIELFTNKVIIIHKVVLSA